MGYDSIVNKSIQEIEKDPDSSCKSYLNSFDFHLNFHCRKKSQYTK